MEALVLFTTLQNIVIFVEKITVTVRKVKVKETWPFVYHIVANTPQCATTSRKSALISVSQLPGRHSANAARPRMCRCQKHKCMST